MGHPPDPQIRHHSLVTRITAQFSSFLPTKLAFIEALSDGAPVLAEASVPAVAARRFLSTMAADSTGLSIPAIVTTGKSKA
jgi:hypothetical protein